MGWGSKKKKKWGSKNLASLQNGIKFALGGVLYGETKHTGCIPADCRGGEWEYNTRGGVKEGTLPCGVGFEFGSQQNVLINPRQGGGDGRK